MIQVMALNTVRRRLRVPLAAGQHTDEPHQQPDPHHDGDVDAVQIQRDDVEDPNITCILS